MIIKKISMIGDVYMGLRDMLRKIFNKDKKVVICGLDNAGKTTIVSFLKTGTFVEHTPTMGKERSTMEVNGIMLDIVDMGGQKDFRSLWLGEMSDAQCVLFMIDAHDISRFGEAREELWKLAPILKKKPLIILANKYDLECNASPSEIISALNLSNLPSFEVLPISCKTGYGIVNAFSKIYYKLTGKKLTKKFAPKALAIYNIGGIPLITKEGNCMETDLEMLRGGLYAAITNFAKESFNSELNQIKLEGHVIIFHRTKYLMGSIILDEYEGFDVVEAETGLRELLHHLENMCPEIEQNIMNKQKISYLVNEYATNIFV